MAIPQHDIDTEGQPNYEAGSPQDDESQETAVEDEQKPERRTSTTYDNDEKTVASSTYASEKMSLFHECVFIATICTAQFTTQVGLTQTLGILHQIGDSFGVTNPGVLSWFIAGYSLTAGTFILVAGRIGDLFGYKRIFVIGMLWFAVWSMIAGLSVYSNEYLFVFARVLQGLGPAALLPNGLALLGGFLSARTKKEHGIRVIRRLCTRRGCVWLPLLRSV